MTVAQANHVVHGGDRKCFVSLLLQCSSERHHGKFKKRANSGGKKLLAKGRDLKVKSLVGKEGPWWAATYEKVLP